MLGQTCPARWWEDNNNDGQIWVHRCYHFIRSYNYHINNYIDINHHS